MEKIFEMKKNINKVIVHNGPFHADDALCVAMVRLWVNPAVEIERVHQVEETYPDDVLVCDIGGRCDEKQFFDHHQLDYSGMTTEEKNEKALCAAEMLWKVFGNREAVEISKYLHEISLHDTGVRLCEVGFIYKDLQPAWDESISMDEAFLNAVELGEKILTRKAQLFQSRKAAKSAYDNAEKIGRTLVLEKFIPWQEYAMESDEIRRAIMVGRDPGSYNLVVKRGRTLPWGSDETEAPAGMTFIHPAKFMAVFSSKEHAIAAAKSLDSDLF